MDENLIARTVREVLQEIGRMEASAENSVSMDAKKAANGYIHGMSLRLADMPPDRLETLLTVEDSPSITELA